MRGVLQSLNENAGAIQAIATAALLLITGWYARLTYRLVKVQEAVQLIALREAECCALARTSYRSTTWRAAGESPAA